MVINGIMYVFMVFWVFVSLVGVLRPHELMTSFPTVMRVVMYRKDKKIPRLLFVLRILFGFFLAIGLFILYYMISGKIEF